jgi:hypothetical protein
MSKPKTIRVVPQTRIMTADSIVHPEGVAIDLATAESERLLGLGHVVEVIKDEVPVGAEVEVIPAAPPAPAPAAEVPERVQVVLPEPAPEPKGKGAKGA